MTGEVVLVSVSTSHDTFGRALVFRGGLVAETSLTVEQYIDQHVPGLKALFFDEKKALFELQEQGIAFLQKLTGLPLRSPDKLIPLPEVIWDQVFSGL